MGTREGRPVRITNSQENMVMLLLQLSGFTPMDIECTLPDKRDQEHYELPSEAEWSTSNVIMC